jgi:Zn-dependent oligopeptidase
MTQNPFFEKFDTPFETLPFDKIKLEHFLPAVERGIAEGKADIAAIVANPEPPTFSNTIEALEGSGKLADTVSTAFFNLNSAETNDGIQALAQQISPLLTAYSNDIGLNKELFLKIEAVFKKRTQYNLNAEQNTLLEKTYKNFVRNGALLNEQQKESLRSIDAALAQTALTFGENVLAENNAYVLVITNKNDLEGIPDDAVEAASELALEKKLEESWAFTLDAPSYMPFITYADNRLLREQIYKASSSKAFKGDERDNSTNVKKIATHRHERAVLLGYPNHAAFILEERMAATPEKVQFFLNDLFENALPFAKEELDTLTSFSKSMGGPVPLERWDVPYYSEKLKKQKFDIDDEALKPYFKLENVVQGAFDTATKLFDLVFEKREDIPVYHEDVITYDVKNADGAHVAVFYADFFPRPGKRQGAWMTSFKNQWIEAGENHRPHVSIVCNFTKPAAQKPSLLTFNEVTTLFHEFGHALHGMLANGQYASLSGTNVFWDFVELPSQWLENWCYEKECLDGFAKHFETGAVLPEIFIQKIKDSANFQSGMATLRQVGLASLDMAWHSQNPEKLESIKAFETAALAKTDLLPQVPESITSCQFSHIFQGGYASGYYSYKWAEVLDADAFEAFKETHLFDKKTAGSFLKNILSAGGSEHPALLYQRFRGRDADPKALLRREGLLQK